MPTKLLSLLLPAAACSIAPSHAAHRNEGFTVPVAGIRAVDCASHNGAIVVRGDGTDIAVAVELTAYGDSQEAAEEQLRALRVEQRVTDGVLVLHGSAVEAPTWGPSPSFAFTLSVPRELALTLTSHNGRIEVDDVAGDVALCTHNGKVEARLASRNIDIEAHNGDIELTAEGVDAVSGRAMSHNGAVEVAVGPQVSCHLVAHSDHGRVAVDGAPRTSRRTRDHVEADYGDGKGRLEIATHNGAVRVH